MERISPLEHESAVGKTRELLDAVQSKKGKVPRLVRTMAHSPATLDAYLRFSDALGGSSLSGRLREQIALSVAEANRCAYCLAAHGAMARRLGLSPDEILASRRSESSDAKEDVILKFARALVENRGQVRDADVDWLRRHGVTDGEITEIVAVVALNIFTNYLHHVAETELDFPVAPPLPADAVESRRN